MSRQLSNKLLSELYGSESADPFLTLLTISHSSFADIRLVNNTVNITSRGNIFQAFPMKITLPPDDGTTARGAKLELDNVSLELITEIRTVTTPISAKLELILASDPDVVEIELAELKISNVQYNAQRITASLFLDDFLNTELTSEKYTPSLYPGIFS